MIGSNLVGALNGTEQICFDYEITGSAVSSISTGNILNGNEDGWYTIIIRQITTANAYLDVIINGDSGANYGENGTRADSATPAAWTLTGQVRWTMGLSSSGETGFTVAKMYAKSGAVRLMNEVEINNVSGTTVTTVKAKSHVWNNSVDNIRSMTFSVSGSTLTVGTRIIILKSNNFTNGTPSGAITSPYVKGAWTRVGRVKLASSASSVTFSGLDGDRDVLYYGSAQVKVGTGAYYYINFNGDTAIANYGQQAVHGINTTVLAGRFAGTDNLYFPTGSSSGTGTYQSGSFLAFAKSGFVRPAIFSGTSGISGTTIEVLRVAGSVWSNTSSKVTSLVWYAGVGTMDVGTIITLYALRPAG